MQHDLDRRSWRRRIDQVGALDADKFVVGDGVEPAQPAQGVKPHRRQAFAFDRRHVGAGGFDPQHLDIFAEDIAHAGLERGVAAAMQHQLAVAAKKPRRVEAERQVAVDAGFRTVRDECLGVTVDPRALHGSMIRKKPAPDLIRGGNRFLERIMLHRTRAAVPSPAGEATRPPPAPARPIGILALAMFGGHRLRCWRRRLWRRRLRCFLVA